MVGKEIIHIMETIRKIKENSSLINKGIDKTISRLLESEEKLKRIETLCELAEADGDPSVPIPAIRIVLEGK